MSLPLSIENPPPHQIIDEERSLPDIKETNSEHEEDTISCSTSSVSLSEFSESNSSSSTQPTTDKNLSAQGKFMEKGWLKSLREKMLQCLEEDGELPHSSVLELKKELVLVFIWCLQGNKFHIICGGYITCSDLRTNLQ
ncbi:uncharacterized protein LOC115225673 [Octopus sinensis]|uniref:Uncharacterized protein LOC115225673 n=1 Tax=Octopus sinensis TaxID=2607531 RepID=A0A6P7TLP6_9MOLL|nr:uncharacterized protein LOC115225673 [Octopus sinensis]